MFLFPPTVPELQARLEKRGTETAQSIEVRMTNAKKEITQALNQLVDDGAADQ